MIQNHQDSYILTPYQDATPLSDQALGDYFSTPPTMDYSTFYPNQNFDMVFPQTATAPQGGKPAIVEDFGSASPPPYASYEGLDGYNGINQPEIMVEFDTDPTQRNRSSSEEKDLTPQQSRRKAQNRAAQRAFRERKERHVKDLEAKLNNLEASSTDMKMENDRLRRELQKVSTENQILRATGGSGPEGQEEVHVGPSSFNPDAFYATLLQPHENKTPSHRVTKSPTTGEKLLGAGATWDMIVQDPLFIDGLVDVGEVCERLKHLARCDGQGPVFEESAIREAIRLSAGSGKDELI